MSQFSLRRSLTAAGVVAMLTLAGCSSNKSLQGASDSSTATTAASVATSVATTVAPTSSDTPSTDTPTTAAAATTTTAAPAPAGWTFVDNKTLPGPLAFPCCASNWSGVASPPLPAAGGALADGIYAIRFDWPADFTQPATATVTRFELCGALPVNSCEDNGGGVYLPDELGVDTTASFTLPVTFDDQLHVVLGGFAGWEAPGFATGNGLDLAELLTALDADYQAAIMQPYLAGATQDELTATLTATPAHGFSAPAGEAAGALVYTHNGSPPLLFQGLLNYESPEATRGSDIVGRIALVVSGGQLTINLYAGFYS